MKISCFSHTYIALLGAVITQISLLFSVTARASPLPTHKASGLPMDPWALTCTDLINLIPAIENAKARMDDWPQLNYYAQANAQVMLQSSVENRVVFLGDSITEQWFSPKFNQYFSQKPYIGRGISSQTTPQILLRFRPDVMTLNPKVVVLLAGTNDIGSNTGPIALSQTQGNIASIAELATTHKIKVVIASVLPTSNYHFDGRDPRGPQTARRPLDKIRALNTWIKQYCSENGHIYLDYYHEMVDSAGMLKSELSDDDLHPNAEGFAIMARLVEEAIAKAFEESSRTTLEECRMDTCQTQSEYNAMQRGGT